MTTVMMPRAGGVDMSLIATTSEPIMSINKDIASKDGGNKETVRSKADNIKLTTDDKSKSVSDANPKLRKTNTESLLFNGYRKDLKSSVVQKPDFKRTKSCPQIGKYNDCREFDNFAGEWIDSKGQNVLISPWGVIRYPNNPKLRFEAVYMGPNHLSVTFDKDPKRRKFVGKLNHENELLIWSNDTKWARKGSKYDPRFQPVNKQKGGKNGHKRRNSTNSKNNSCLVQ